MGIVAILVMWPQLFEKICVRPTYMEIPYEISLQLTKYM